jgi:hypothetical protein
VNANVAALHAAAAKADDVQVDTVNDAHAGSDNSMFDRPAIAVPLGLLLWSG